MEGRNVKCTKTKRESENDMSIVSKLDEAKESDYSIKFLRVYNNKISNFEVQ